MDIAGYTLGLCIFLGVILPLAGWYIGRFEHALWLRSGRRELKRGRTIIAEYEPPDQLRPAEIAYLYDQTFGKEELLATLFDLEQREKLQLVRSPSVAFEADFSIGTSSKGTEPDLLSFEQEVILAVRAMKSPVLWSTLQSDNTLWNTGFEDQLASELQMKGYFTYSASNHARNVAMWVIAASLSFSGTVLPALFEKSSYQDQGFASLDRDLAIFTAGLLWLPSLLSLGLGMHYGTVLYRRALNMEHGTQRLRDLWPAIEGFREYINQVELDNIQFESSSNALQARNHALSYAVALNLPTNWQDRFSD